MSTSKESGLGLFDDAASAAGSFPSSIRGYERASVDEYVRSLEASMVETRRRASGLEQQLASLQNRLEDADASGGGKQVDYSDLGGRASDILRLAEEQSREVLDHATQDAEKLRETARRDADRERQEAAHAGTELRRAGATEVQELRDQAQEEVRGRLEQAQAEVAALLDAARRQAEALQRSADHEAQTSRETAYLDTENLRRSVDTEVAGIRQQVAAEREAALQQLRDVHQDAVTKTSALLGEATEHHQESTDRLQLNITEAARVRDEALAEAERIRLEARTEAEQRIAAARKQAAAITDRTQQEFAWRKQQLKRETDLLSQRKQAVLNQLASLSALAEQTADGFPDLDDLPEFDGEEGDQTVMVSPSQAPALPPEVAARSQAGAEQGGTDQGVANQGGASQGGSGQGRSAQGGLGRNGGDREDPGTLEIDGDATVLVPAAQLPAGTEHLTGGPRPQQG